MAAPMEARFAFRKFCKLLASSQQSHLLQARQMSFMDKLKFLQKKPEQEVEEDLSEDLQDYKDTQLEPARPIRKRESIEELKSYKPQADAIQKIGHIVEEVYGQQENWLEIKLDNRIKKFNLLTQVIDELDRDIGGIDLNEMNTVQDVIKYFNIEVKDTSVLEDLTKLDLPKNLHINLEAIRFHPDTDKIFDGITAFPGRPTIVSSIKYKRKYKGFDGGDAVNDPDKIIGL